MPLFSSFQVDQQEFSVEANAEKLMPRKHWTTSYAERRNAAACGDAAISWEYHGDTHSGKPWETRGNPRRLNIAMFYRRILKWYDSITYRQKW